MIMHADLVRTVEEHLRRTGETPTAFGKRVARDPRLVFQLREGRSPQLRLVERIIAACGPGAEPQDASSEHAT